MGPSELPASQLSDAELIAEFELACRGGDHEFAPEYRAELSERLSKRAYDADLYQQLKEAPLYAAVIQRLVAQQEKGIKKYGALLSGKTYSVDEYIEHVQQELTDALVYFEGLKQQLEQLNSSRLPVYLQFPNWVPND
jgi:hypothetical protein